jgi:DUF1680 family protein
MQGEAKIEISDNIVSIKQETEYPWKGDVKIVVSMEKPGKFTLNLRIPGWARNQPVPGGLYTYMDTVGEEVTLKVNEEAAPIKLNLGYAALSRRWKEGDMIELHLPMPARRVLAHEKVKADVGRVAVERGPLVYCAEWPDNFGRVHNIILKDDFKLKTEYRADLLQGISLIIGRAEALKEKEGRIITEEQKLVLIPYYAWAHRGKGEMAVWLARTAEKAVVQNP